MLGAARDRQAVARQISNEWVQANAEQTSKEASRGASKCIQIQSVTTTISINSSVAAFIGFIVHTLLAPLSQSCPGRAQDIISGNFLFKLLLLGADWL